MIISLPVQTAVCCSRALGALVVLVAVQVSVPGLYLPPVLKALLPLASAPDDHLAAGPNCSVQISRYGRIGGAGGCPAACGRIIAARQC